MSLMTSVNEHNNSKPIVIVGKSGSKKLEKALTFVSDTPIIQYANEFDLPDIHSIPSDVGIIIQEAHYKPKTDAIYNTLVTYSGQVVLTADNQKDVPKKLYGMCKLKRAKVTLDDLHEKAPHAEVPDDYKRDIYSLVMEYMKDADRDKMAILLKENKPPDVQFISWLSPNMHPNRLTFTDFVVKRRWSTDYFYEMLAFSHDGRKFGRVHMPKRGSYSKLPKVARKLGMDPRHSYLLKDLMKNADFKDFMRSRLDGVETKALGLGTKKRRKKLDRVLPNNDLRRWV